MVDFQSNRRLSTIPREEIEAKIWVTFLKRQFSQTKNRTIWFIFRQIFLVCCLLVENGLFRYGFGSILVRWIELSSSIEPSNLIELPGSIELELEPVRFGRSLINICYNLDNGKMNDLKCSGEWWIWSICEKSLEAPP